MLRMLGSSFLPCFRRYNSSSPPLPNMYGSPPFSRTTRAPCAANYPINLCISSCFLVWKPWRLPTYTITASEHIRLRMSLVTNLKKI